MRWRECTQCRHPEAILPDVDPSLIISNKPAVQPSSLPLRNRNRFPLVVAEDRPPAALLQRLAVQRPADERDLHVPSHLNRDTVTPIPADASPNGHAPHTAGNRDLAWHRTGRTGNHAHTRPPSRRTPMATDDKPRAYLDLTGPLGPAQRERPYAPGRGSLTGRALARLGNGSSCSSTRGGSVTMPVARGRCRAGACRNRGPNHCPACCTGAPRG